MKDGQEIKIKEELRGLLNPINSFKGGVSRIQNETPLSPDSLQSFLDTLHDVLRDWKKTLKRVLEEIE